MADKGRKAVEKKGQSLEVLQIVYAKATDLRPNAYNPNRQSDHDFHLLVMSMLEDGFTQPIVAQRASGEIVDGEHRWTAGIVRHWLTKVRRIKGEDITLEQVKDGRARRLDILAECEGLTVPVVYVDMTPEQQRIATLRHNRARGSEDIELTAALMRDLEKLGALDWATDSLMLSADEVQKMLQDIPVPEALAADDFSPAWNPDATGNEGEAIANAGSTAGVEIGAVDHGGRTVAAMSREGIEALRNRQKAIAEAKTQEEATMARQGMGLFRLSLMFSGEEAKLVERVLGREPAERLLELCRAADAG